MPLEITSTAISPESSIPEVYSKEGGNVSPPIAWTGVPPETRSLVLIVDDPDAPKGLFTHWIVYGLTPKTTSLAEHQPVGGDLPNGARQGLNGVGETGYTGPNPPSGTHRYFFHLYALDTDTDVPSGLSRQEIDGAVEGHILEEATLMGRYTFREKTQTAR